MSDEGRVSFESVEAAVNPYDFRGDDGAAYANAANFAAKTILAAARRSPVAFGAALDAYREDPHTRAIDALLTEDERAVVVEGSQGVTGFQWGWAVQTVAYLLEQAPVPNGAIMTFGPVGSD